MSARGVIAIILLQFTVTSAAVGNPIPPNRNYAPLVEKALERVVYSEGTSGGGELGEQLDRHGLAISPHVLFLIRTNMALLEPFFLAYQSRASRIDGHLHEVFLNWASPAAQASMTALLRERLGALCRSLPNDHELRRLRQLVVCGEYLADFGDSSAVDAIAAARDSLRIAFPGCVPSFHPTRTPAWFLTMALKHIHDHRPGPVLSRTFDSKPFRLRREASDIVSLKVMAEGGDWHEVAPSPERDARILSHLAGSNSAQPHGRDWQVELGRSSLVIAFSDDSVVTIDVSSLGVRYHDESRCAAPTYWILSEPLVHDIWNLLEQFEDLIEL